MVWPYEDGVYPEGYFLEQGEEPVPIGRGHYKPAEFARRHGEAIVHYRVRKPFYIDNALFPDGSRGRVGPADLGRLYRRPLTHEDQAWDFVGVRVPIKWRWGELAITPEDVAFSDRPDAPVARIYSDYHTSPLQRALYGQPEVKALADSYIGAAALFFVLLNSSWARGDETSSCDTSDEAALIVRDIRGLGESLSDIWVLGYDHAAMKEAYGFIENHLREKGWTRVRDW
jgi:hypothetical protein